MHILNYTSLLFIEDRIMQVLEKMSTIGTPVFKKSSSKVKHDPSLYVPTTRLQKIRKNMLTYPASTYNKIVFISFQRGVYGVCLPSIKLNDMLSKINTNCYKQWQRNKYHCESNPFKYLDWVTNGSLALMCILAIIYILLDLENTLEINSIFQIFFTLIISTFLISLITYCKQNDDYDFDLETINAIKANLEQLNSQQILQTDQRPRFVWQYQNDCIWIALKIIRFDSE